MDTVLNTQLPLYIASVLGAIALLLIMPKRRWNFRIIGALLGAATVGALWFVLAEALPEDLGGIGQPAFLYQYVFSAIAIAAAVRVITHTRPVYSALWFVLVVLSSAGLFLTLAAEFMAIAMIIIYAGAILVTYMFVIMLASQSQPADQPDVSPVYDRLSREPFAAIVAGFVLLAVLLSVMFEPMDVNPLAAGPTDAELREDVLADRPVLENLLAEPAVDLPAQEQLASAMRADMALSNGERIGVDLFMSHPLGLELAGIILLVSLIGAVVIARRQVEEDEVRTVAAPDPTGATVHPQAEAGPDEAESMGQSGGRMGV